MVRHTMPPLDPSGATIAGDVLIAIADALPGAYVFLRNVA